MRALAPEGRAPPGPRDPRVVPVDVLPVVPRTLRRVIEEPAPASPPVPAPAAWPADTADSGPRSSPSTARRGHDGRRAGPPLGGDPAHTPCAEPFPSATGLAATGVTFSDGTPLDATAVAANFDSFGLGFEERNFRPSEVVNNYESSEVLDPLTVRFRFSKPSPGFL